MDQSIHPVLVCGCHWLVISCLKNQYLIYVSIVCLILSTKELNVNLILKSARALNAIHLLDSLSLSLLLKSLFNRGRKFASIISNGNEMKLQLEAEFETRKFTRKITICNERTSMFIFRVSSEHWAYHKH